MAVIALDIGGTKIAGALFSNEKEPVERIVDVLSGKKGNKIGQIIVDQVRSFIKLAESRSESVKGIGVCVPGIYDSEKGTVWAPNISGWEAYPLLEKITEATDRRIPVDIDSDRSCCILGEVWQGNAQGCKSAIFMAVGTGIGAGIMMDGKILHGNGNSAGAIGWMALDRPHKKEYSKYGCFEYHASGEGLARIARKHISNDPEYQGGLGSKAKKEITGRDIFSAYAKNDLIAERVIQEAIEFWGMGIANLISIFNPEKIILGGGVFNTAGQFLEQIKTQAERWAQPVAFSEVSIELADLGSDAGLYGAAYLALSAYNEKSGT